MRAYRLAKREYTALDGEGAWLYGGRWNSIGVPVVYLASSMSLALVELLVHLDPGIFPPAMMAITIDIADTVACAALDPLPGNWNRTPAPIACQQAGDEWVRSARSAALLVPSVVVPSESNILINPAHPDSARATIIDIVPFPFDSRFLRPGTT